MVANRTKETRSRTARFRPSAWTLAAPLALAGLLGAIPSWGESTPIVWEDDDDRPVPEPALDPEGDAVWWDHAEKLSFYQIGKIADLGNLGASIGRRLGIARPDEAGNLNALDETPSSTWFTNRHHRSRLSAEELVRGPNAGPPPSSAGPLRVVSAWENTGATFGIVFVDSEDRKYVVKFDPPGFPDLSTSSEVVASKIFHALGWNVPEYHLVSIDPARLEVAAEAKIQDAKNEKRPMTPEDLRRLLGRSHAGPDGRFRASASRFIPGTAKGPPRMEGVRPDDPNDRVRHEDRRDLRGLRVPSAWVHYTDARRGNLYDTFVRDPESPEGHGHLVHYVLDFGTSFGSDQSRWKPARFGHEYFVDPGAIVGRLFTLGLRVEPWEDARPSAHRALGTFRAGGFDPEGWKAFYPNPLFDHATTRDLFWGAKLVVSLDEANLRTIVGTGEWSEPGTEDELFRILWGRRQRIAETFFDAGRINPVDRFEPDGTHLRFVDLAVETGAAPPARARYRYRTANGPWSTETRPRVRLPEGTAEAQLVLQTSHDGGREWSPSTTVRLGRSGTGWQILGLERAAR